MRGNFAPKLYGVSRLMLAKPPDNRHLSAQRIAFGDRRDNLAYSRLNLLDCSLAVIIGYRDCLPV
jgi:hypothetical protein